MHGQGKVHRKGSGDYEEVKLRINKNYAKTFPKNCPIIEQTADGVEVGVCTFYLPDGKTCPRHGVVKEVVRLGSWKSEV